MQLASSCLKNKKRLSKQLSMCETPRDLAWEKRRRQMLRPRNGSSTDRDDLTDEDWNELKGCIELGFAFNEEDGHKLCGTLPALDLYFAVNRQLSPSPVLTPHSSTSTSTSSSSSSLGGRGSSCESPRGDCETWRVCSPGKERFEIVYNEIKGIEKKKKSVILMNLFRARSEASEGKIKTLGSSSGMFGNAIIGRKIKRE